MAADAEISIHEQGFVNAFIAKSYRNRLLFELQQRRSRFINRFCHRAMIYLDSRFVIPIPPPNSDPSEILRLLKSRGAGRTCYAISMSDDLDSRILPLADALASAVGFGLPTILSSHAGQLAYLETEQEFGPPERFILLRPPLA